MPRIASPGGLETRGPVLLLPLERSVGCGVLLAFFPLIGLVAILGNAGHPSGWTGLTRVGLWAVVAAIIVALGFVVGWRRRLEIHRGLRTVTDRWSLFGIPIRKRITPLYGVEGVVVKSRMDHQKYQAFQVQSVHLGSLVVLSAMVDEEATVKRVAGQIAEHLEIPVIEQDGR